MSKKKLVKARRDFLLLATTAVGTVGMGALTIPFIEQLRPPARAESDNRLDVDLSHLEVGMSMTIVWRGQPIIIRHRAYETVQEQPASTIIDRFRDPLARNANLPVDTIATDSARSMKIKDEEWLVFVAICTHLGCVVREQAGQGWLCPCHGSRYDGFGRVLNGPAERNLMIPPYQFIADRMIRIG